MCNGSKITINVIKFDIIKRNKYDFDNITSKVLEFSGSNCNTCKFDSIDCGLYNYTTFGFNGCEFDMIEHNEHELIIMDIIKYNIINSSQFGFHTNKIDVTCCNWCKIGTIKWNSYNYNVVTDTSIKFNTTEYNIWKFDIIWWNVSEFDINKINFINIQHNLIQNGTTDSMINECGPFDRTLSNLK